MGRDKSMIRLLVVIIMMIVIASPLMAEKRYENRYNDQWYLDNYPFMYQQGRFFTFESEFDWPDGFKRIDSSKLSPYAYWVSNMPIWHKDKDVSAGFKGKKYDADEVSRVIQFQWRTHKLQDNGIPTQMIGEYLLSRGIQEEWSVVLNKGETVRYKDFLGGKKKIHGHTGISFEPTVARPHSEKEFGRFVDLCLIKSTYKTLASNCDSIDAKALLPGDLIIGHNHNGIKGKSWVVLCVIKKKKERRYLVGAGCEVQCAFHIPLYNENRSNPWLTLDQVKELAADQEYSGYFRPNNLPK